MGTMNWRYDVVYIRDGYDNAIIDTETKDIIAIVSNLDNQFVNHIINEHNKAISLARKEGAKIAKEVYKSHK